MATMLSFRAEALTVARVVGASKSTKGQRASPLLRAVAPAPAALRQSARCSNQARALGVRTMAAYSPIPGKADGYTNPDQPARFAEQKATNDIRAIDLDQVYDPSSLKGKRVLVTGANRGIGLALAKELKAVGAIVIATVRKTSPELDAVEIDQIVEGIDVTDTSCMQKMVQEITAPLDVVVNNAGYFYEPVETVADMNFEEQLKMIDICAVGPLRITAALVNAGLVAADGKVAMITSQGGSIAWRDVQNPEGGDYGHHMSKAAANMGGKLLAQELKHKGITVTMLHPGFNRTEMTAKYAEIWEVEGAVDVSVGAKRVVHEIGRMSLDKAGTFVNCEDGLLIPW